MPLAGHGDVLAAVEAKADRAAGERRPEGRDGGIPVRLHLLAPEASTHAQALHRHLVAAQAQDVGDDLLGLARVLGAALHEDLAALVDHRQGGVRLEVEVLLAAELELTLDDVGGAGQGGVGVPTAQRGPGALERLGRDRLVQGDQ